jgi:L-seryl-tRNA(Ser) seleniumtransferase
MTNPLRDLPAVNDVLEAPPLASLNGQHSHERVVECVRQELDRARESLKEKAAKPPDAAEIARRAAERLARDNRPNLRRVINATGIVLHTNLGRAPITEEAARAAADAARGYLNLELDLESGKRSSRQDAIRNWLRQLTGAESATAVNNCAAATVIVLRALAAGKEVVVSRGQLIEIGGSFRIPDIMGVSGATLREVGTTNMTRLSDYEKAITPNTAALMRVHTSNYRITGHTEAVPLADLIALGKKHNLPVIDDVGSGALFDFSRLGLTGEPLIRESIAAGADLVLFSGDKLLGGPQAGIVIGKAAFIQRIEKDPLMRAFRLDKMTLAALEATLRLYLNEARAIAEVPVLRMLHAPMAELKRRAESLAAALGKIAGVSAAVEESSAFVGGGSLPEQSLPTYVVAVTAKNLSDEQLATRLRTGDPAVLGRVQAGKLLLDVRTVFAEQEPDLIESVRKATQAV